MYSVVLMMALTTGGDSAALGHRGGGCCGAEASCGCSGGGHHRGGHRHHGGGGCCGAEVSTGCSSCGSYGGGHVYGGGCANGSCGFVVNDVAPTTAVIVVSLPADAKLTFDGEATASTSEQRTFVAPVPEAGREYHYTLKAQVERDGKPLVVEQVITVRAGEETHVTLTPEVPTVGVAQR